MQFYRRGVTPTREKSTIRSVADPGYTCGMDWIIASLVLSLVLTIALNVGVRAFPGTTQRATQRVDRWASEAAGDDRRARVRVYFPWKAMLIASVVLTVVLNLLARRG